MKPTNVLFFLISVILIAVFSSCQSLEEKVPTPKASQGKIDLANWDFSKDGVVPLSGDWAFFWRQFLYSSDGFRQGSPQRSGFVAVPDDWSRYSEADSSGYASYRLSIKLSERNQPLALKINMVRTSQRVYLNGELAGTVGTPGISEETTIPMNYPVVIDLPVGHNKIDLVIEVANFHHQTAGIRGEIELGLKSDIRTEREENLISEILIAGCLLVMGIYHFILFSLRSRDRTPFYFGLLCLLQCVFTLQRGERYFFYLFEGVGWELITRSGFLAHVLTIFCFVLFIHWLFNQEFSPLAIRIYRVLTGLFLLLGAVMPMSHYTTIGTLLDLFTAITAIHVIHFLFRLYLKRAAGSGIFLLGILVIFLTLMNDILVSNWVIRSPLIFPYGFLFFVFCQAYLLSVRFNNAFVAVENLTGELKSKSDQLIQSNQELSDLNQNLERRVVGRTRELSEINQELQKEIEERRLIEEMLRESEQSFRSLADQTFMGITIVQNQMILYTNKAAAEIIGYPVDLIINQMKGDLQQLVHADDLAEVLQKAETLEIGSEIVQMPLRLNTREKGVKWVETYLKRILHQGKKATMITLIDVTERRENEARMESLRRELVNSAHRAGMADIAANTLHNVGNILNSVKTSVFSMEREISQKPHENLIKANTYLKTQLDEMQKLPIESSSLKKIAEYYQLLEQNFSTQYGSVKEELSRLSGMVDSISRVILMQQAYATGDAYEELLSPSLLVEEAINMQKDALSMHQIRVVKNLQDVPSIPLQKTKLLYILTNLILNAIQAMEATPEGERRLEFTSLNEEELIVISIKDSGCGIRKEDLGKVFSFGFSTKKNSHGYGLHSCANYMNEMKGEIKVLSEGKSKGAMFQLRFPAERQLKQPEAKEWSMTPLTAP